MAPTGGGQTGPHPGRQAVVIFILLGLYHMQHHSFYLVSLSVILQINRGQLCGVPLMAHQVIMARFVDHCDQNSLLLPDSRLRRLVLCTIRLF